MKKQLHFLILASFLLTLFVACKGNSGQQNFSLPKIEEQPDTQEKRGEADQQADPTAQKGGEIALWLGDYPKSLNYWIEINHQSSMVMDLMFMPLAAMHPLRDEPVGLLASHWESAEDSSPKNPSKSDPASKDQKIYTFHIHAEAKWSDGQDVSADDVLFYYDTMMNPKHLTTVQRIDLQRIERPVALDKKTLQIKTKDSHWGNFWTAAALQAFPKHLWQGKDFNQITFDFPVSNGPYTLGEVKTDRYVLMKRKANWWGRRLKFFDHKYNFDYIRFRFMADQTKVLEALKKGEIDVYNIYSSALWSTQADFDLIQKNYIHKQEIFNQRPVGFQGFALNMRRPLFQDKALRLALAYALNRNLLIEKIMYNNYFSLNSYFSDLYPNLRKPDFELIPYDLQKARNLLEEAGWKVNAQGWREKKGQTLKVVFLGHTENSTDKHYNIYLEDLKKIGIQGVRENVSNTSFQKRMSDYDFDAMWINFGSSRLNDPEQMWSSAQADLPAGNNFAGLKDAAVDALIEKQKTEYDLSKRQEILRQIDSRLLALNPYVLLWQNNRTRLLYWHKFGMPKAPLGKYGFDDAILSYWWIQSEQEKELSEAKKQGQPLKLRPAQVRFE